MTTDTNPQRWFATGGQAYAEFRPQYPAALAQALAQLAPTRRVALDVGCGSGQLTQLLASQFEQVIGLDPSRSQLEHASGAQNVRYDVAAAEQLPLGDGTVSLLTAAQAAHWFDLPQFYAQAQRVLCADGVIALISYGVLSIADAPLQARFQQFYDQEIASYWPPQRQLVDSGYATLDFPFEALPAPACTIEQAWDLAQLLGYVSTWSAVQQVHAAQRSDLLERFAADMAALWGAPEVVRRITWPVRMRLGKKAAQPASAAR